MKKGFIIDYGERVQCNICGKMIEPTKEEGYCRVYLEKEERTEGKGLMYPRCEECSNEQPNPAPTTKVVEKKGRFKLRYGYDSSMSFSNILGVLESKDICPEEVAQIMLEMNSSGVAARQLANYLADYYKLFGW